MTPNAYMTDEAWAQIVPNLCESIRDMDVIRDHPQWWVLLTLDGFGSHVNVDEALKIFADSKILIAKEEGDTSHVNQAYDQLVAKADKQYVRHSLNMIKATLGRAIDQWILISIAINAQNSIPKEVWIESFKKVNMHPKTRVPFQEWIKVLDNKGILSSEKYFEKRDSLYDAMPACWKKLSIFDRRVIIGILDDIYNSKQAGKPLFTSTDILKLTKYVKLNEVFKLRACYKTAKVDESVITRVTEELNNGKVQEDKSAIDQFFSWKPLKLIDKYRQNRNDKNTQLEYFHHITNHVSRLNWQVGYDHVQPSAYLDVEISKTQVNLLNPTHKDVLMGYLTYDAMGDGATQLIAKRRICCIEGNFNSYAKLLNSKERLAAVKEHNELCAAVAEVSAEQIKAKEARKWERQEKLASNNKKKELGKEIEHKRKEELLPSLTIIVQKYTLQAASAALTELINLLKKDLKVTTLKDLFIYYYNINKNEIYNKRKDELIDLFAEKLTNKQDSTFADDN